MNIVIQSEDYLPNIGGIANHVHNLAAALSQKNHRVTILTTRKDVPSPRNLSVWDIRYSRNKNPHLIEIPILYSPRNFLRNCQIRLRFTRHLKNLIKNGSCDLIHYHYWDFDARVVKPLRSLCPIVFSNHSSQFLECFDNPEQHERLKQQIFFANAVITSSQELKDKTLALGYDPTRCFYIPNGVETDKFFPDPLKRKSGRERMRIEEDAIVIICARRPVPKNGLLYFCRALQYLKDLQKKCVILFAGLSDPADDPNPDDYKKSLWDQLRDLSNSFAIHYLGVVPQDQMLSYYQISDISVLPSLKEATSITGLESMACELPLVASRIGGIPELISNNVEGFLTAPAAPHELANKLRELILNNVGRKEMGRRARVRVVQSFSWSNAANKTLQVYSSLLEDKEACHG